MLIVLDEEKAAKPLSFYNVVRAGYTRVLSKRSEAELQLFAAMLDEFSTLSFDDQLKELAD